ncbi:MAG TPA: PKD domain-containing protein [Candidatus Aquilonibacter sp.]|nr:PKD domain-containing protein [Candidatus Aquilonibacter sp.]
MRRESLGLGVTLLLLLTIGTANAGVYGQLFGTQGATINQYQTQGICLSNSPALITINSIPLIIVSLIAISISLDVIAIGYIIGKLAPGTQLTPWVRKEYWEVAKSAMLIAGVYAILVFLGSLSTGLVGVSAPAGGGLSSPFSALTTSSQQYLAGIFCGQAITKTDTAVSWAWGDGDVGFGTSASHLYATPGTYPITATVQNANGDKVSIEHDVIVSATGTSSFTSDPKTGLGMEIVFSGTQNMMSVSTQAYTSEGTTGGSDYVSYLIGLSMGVGFMQGVTVGYYLPIPTPGISFTLGTSFNPYKNTMLLHNIGDAKTYENLINDVMGLIILPTYTIIGMMYYLLPMFVFAGLAFLIPMGIIFRSMPFLRGIGGTLFAIGIGISVVLPSVLLIVNLPVTSMITPYILTTPLQTQQQSFFGLSPANLPAFPGGAGGADAFGSFSSIYPALNGIIGFSIYCVVQFVLFILDMMITFPLVEALAKSLGGTIDVEFGRFRIK